jgi:hypothetical protein
MDGVKIANVGVSVTVLDGRLHASMASTRANTNKKLRDFIAILLYFCPILPNDQVTGNRPFGLSFSKGNLSMCIGIVISSAGCLDALKQKSE